MLEVGDYLKMENIDFKVVEIGTEVKEKYVEESDNSDDFLAESMGTFEALEELS